MRKSIMTLFLITVLQGVLGLPMMSKIFKTKEYNGKRYDKLGEAHSRENIPPAADRKPSDYTQAEILDKMPELYQVAAKEGRFNVPMKDDGVTISEPHQTTPPRSQGSSKASIKSFFSRRKKTTAGPSSTNHKGKAKV